MNRHYKKICLLLWVVLAGMTSSCVYEDEVPCPCDIRFVYDYNMEFADAFPQQVNDLTLFIFNADGQFITSLTDQGPQLNEEYRMQLSLKPGRYRLVAWAGLQENPSCYDLVDHLTPGVSTYNDLTLTLHRANSTDPHYDNRLTDLWHGQVSEFSVEQGEPSHAVMPLVKDVNRFRILLQTADGDALSAKDFSFSITADNHRYDWANNPISDFLLSYDAYLKEEVTIDNGDSAEPDAIGTRSGEPIHALVAELNTLRLTTDRTQRFIIHDETSDRDIFNINLVSYLEKLRLSQYDSMPLQEYLDRENTYDIILYMGQRRDVWVMLAIQINAWRMVFNETEL